MRLLFLTWLIGSAALLHAQSNCNAYFPFEEGMEMEYANFNRNGKLESTSTQRVTLVEDTDGGAVAKVAFRLTDKKGKALTDGEYDVTCADNTLMFDVSNMLPAEMMAGFGAMDVSVTGDAMQLPAQLEVGMALPDASTVIEAGSSGINVMKMTVDITDRQVAARETVETPAGNFDCFKVTYNISSKMMLVNQTFQAAEWYADGIGVVRSESYNKNGKLQSYMELQRFEGK